MTLARLRPETDFDRNVPRTFSDMLDTFFNDAVSTNVNGGTFAPAVDVIEHDQNYEIRVNLPGMKKSDINIELEDSTLSISGERSAEKEEKNKRYHLVETRFGKFSRSFTLPRNINRESINAKMTDGVLMITIEKSEDAVSRQIQIK